MDQRDDHPYDLPSGEVARLLGVAQSTLARWAEAGAIGGMRTPGGHWRFRRLDVDEFISSRTRAAS